MTTEQLDEKAIFDVARQIESPEALSAYLKQVCSDDHALRQRIENMVRAGRENSHFLEKE